VFELFPFLALVPGLITLPGWLWARRRRPQSVWLLFLAVPGLVTWIALAWAGVGSQSLGNVVELFAVAAAAIAAGYAKFILFDRWTRSAGVVALVAVVVLTVVLRLLMPVVPE
jgi:hypothetical protein